MKKNLAIIISIISLVATIFVVQTLPETIPMHWNVQGQIDGYGSKNMLFILAILPFFIELLMRVTKKIDPKRNKIEIRSSSYDIIRTIVTLLFVAINWTIILVIKYDEIPMNVIMSVILGVGFIILGNYMPRVPQNHFVGVRLPWTIDNELVWKRTNRFGGYLFVLYGLIMIISAFIFNEITHLFSVGLIIIGLAVLTIDSYLYYKKITKE